MKYTAIIEIPKGSDRRIHKAQDGSGFVDFGPIKEQIPINDGVMPVAYGYIEGVMNATEGDEVDVLVFSSRLYKTGDRVGVEIIGMLTRADGDHKVLAVDNSVSIGSFEEMPEQERDLILKYFGFKSGIISIDVKDKAIEYLEQCRK